MSPRMSRRHWFRNLVGVVAGTLAAGTAKAPAGAPEPIRPKTARRLYAASEPFHTTTFTYDVANRLTSVCDPIGSTQTFIYDRSGARLPARTVPRPSLPNAVDYGQGPSRAHQSLPRRASVTHVVLRQQF